MCKAVVKIDSEGIRWDLWMNAIFCNMEEDDGTKKNAMAEMMSQRKDWELSLAGYV